MAINLNVTRADSSEYDAELLLGIKGDPGKSAYEYAVDAGYTGTETDFTLLMESLEEFQDVTATAETLDAGESATASFSDGELSLGIPKGYSAGFGTVSATVDANHGVPAVTVTASGEDTAKNFAFAFSNLQPAPYDDSVIQARMDSFTNLEEGSTTGDAELIDGRVGADGVTYANIGDAIRGQVTDLKSDINDIDESLLYKIKTLRGAYIGWVSLDSYTIGSGLIRVSEGDVLTYDGLKTYNSAPYFSYITFLDSNQQAISELQILKSDGTAITLVVPKNTVMMQVKLGHNQSTGVSVSPSEGANVVISYRSIAVNSAIELLDSNVKIGKLISPYWKTGTIINASGAEVINDRFYTSDTVELQDNASIFYDGELSTIDEIPFYLYCAEYDENNNFIIRNEMLNAVNGVTGTNYAYKPSKSAKSVRFSFGIAGQGSRAITSSDLSRFSATFVSGLETRLDTLEKHFTHEYIPTVGQANVIKRCRQLTDIKWTPVANLKRIDIITADAYGDEESGETQTPFYEDVFTAGVEYCGIPYSSSEGGNDGYSSHFVGIDIPIEAFVTSVCNEDSVVYQESSYHNNNACIYGTICSSFACYALDLGAFYNTSQIMALSGMANIGALVTSGVRMPTKQLQLADLVIKAGHVAIITDFIRDKDGDIAFVEVSESTKYGNYNWDVHGGQFGGICRRKMWTVDEFYEYFAHFNIYRYRLLSSVTYTPNKYVDAGGEGNRLTSATMACVPYYGENFAYKYGHIANTDILCQSNIKNATRGCELEVYKDNTLFGTYSVVNGKATIGFADIGEYKARLVYAPLAGSGLTTTLYSNYCHWKVV